MMFSASFSAAASAAIWTSWVALSDAGTCCRVPPCGGLSSVVTIKPSFIDVLHNSIWNQVPHRLPRPYPFAALGRGDRQRGHLDQAHPATGQARIGEVVARTSTPYEMREVEELIRVTPAQNLTEGVGAGYEEQLDVRPVYFAHLPQRVDCVGLPWTLDVNATDRERGVGRGRDDRHQVAVLGRGRLAPLFHPRLTGRHEDDLVQCEQVRHLARGHEVPVVDGIEGASQKPQTTQQDTTLTSGSDGTAGRPPCCPRVTALPAGRSPGSGAAPDSQVTTRTALPISTRGTVPAGSARTSHDRPSSADSACSRPGATSSQATISRGIAARRSTTTW